MGVITDHSFCPPENMLCFPNEIDFVLRNHILRLIAVKWPNITSIRNLQFHLNYALGVNVPFTFEYDCDNCDIIIPKIPINWTNRSVNTKAILRPYPKRVIFYNKKGFITKKSNQSHIDHLDLKRKHNQLSPTVSNKAIEPPCKRLKIDYQYTQIDTETIYGRKSLLSAIEQSFNRLLPNFESFINLIVQGGAHQFTNEELQTVLKQCHSAENLLDLILSVNRIDNLDTKALGLYVSILLQAASSQNTLNIKHLAEKKTTDMINTELENDPFVQLVVHKYNLANICIAQPKSDITLLYQNQSLHDATAWKVTQLARARAHLDKLSIDFDVINFPYEEFNVNSTVKWNWIRLKLNTSEIDVIEQIILNIPPILRLTSVYKLSPVIIEFYFEQTSFVVNICEHFQNCQHVESIIFFSNQKLFKQKYLPVAPLAVLSNLLKFYYCYNMSTLDFYIIPTSIMNCMHTLLLNYIISILFLYKDNLKTNHSDWLTTPLNMLSGGNPRRNIQAKQNKMEPILEDFQDGMPDMTRVDSLTNNPLSLLSLAENKQHKMYSLSNDHDFRICGLGSRLGARNIHSVFVEFDYE